MYMLFRLVLIIAMLTIIVHCQGDGGDDDGDYDYSADDDGDYDYSADDGDDYDYSGPDYSARDDGDHDYSNRTYKSPNNSGGMQLEVVIGCLIVGCVSIWIIFRGKESFLSSNEKFIRETTGENQSYKEKVDCFRSGTWTSQYYQYAKWHGPHQLSLSFDNRRSKVTGKGTDDVGQFTVNGVFSLLTYRMGLTKTYISGTGNPKQNHGHIVTIQMTWNPDKHLFEGKWCVDTSNYYGKDSFELKFKSKTSTSH